jgi:hypothetical protein
MKVLALPIEMVSYTDNKGVIKPIRFRLANEDESFKVIKIDKIVTKETEKLAGNVMVVYKCQSLVDGIQRIYEIKYELTTCRWILFKM